MSKTAKLWRRKLSAVIEQRPHLYRNVMLFKHRNAPFIRRIVSRGHDIVIEGYPRSANSFAVSAFMYANGWRDPRVATHMHSPAQVVLAAEWKIPTLLNIRAPADAIPAYMAYAGQMGQIDTAGLSLDEKRAWIREQTLNYARFYETVAPLKAAYVLAPFEQVTQDFGVLIDQLNDRFNCRFDRFEHTEEAVQKIFTTRAVHLSPDAKRDGLKPVFTELYSESQNTDLRNRAESAYRRVFT